jgi:hypothetical protein
MMVQFQTLDVGQRFFDPYCGEYFIKVCANAAQIDSGGDAITGLVTFEYSEEVEL